MLTSRFTATSNAVFTVENMFVWNLLPPCIATVAAIALIGTVSLPMSAGLPAIAAALLIAAFPLPAPGQAPYHEFPSKAAPAAGQTLPGFNDRRLGRARFCP